MSMCDLPAEIVGLIMQHLNTQDKAKFVRTSKLSYVNGNPFLYEKIQFHINQVVSIKYLLLTLLQNESLAKHIKELHFEPRKHVSSMKVVRQQPLWIDHAYQRRTLQKPMVASAVSRFSLPPETMLWTDAIVREYPSLDRMVSLIVLMVTPLRHLSLRGNIFPITLRKIGQSAAASRSQAAISMPTSLTLQGHNKFEYMGALSSLTGVQHLELVSINVRLNISPTVGKGTLRTLVLDDVELSRYKLHEKLASPQFEALEVLSLSNVARILSSDSLRILQKSMSDNLYALHTFYCTDTEFPDFDLLPFASFADFKQLKHLCIDVDLYDKQLEIIEYDTNDPELYRRLPDLRNMHRFLPPTIQNFQLHGIPIRSVHLENSWELAFGHLDEADLVHAWTKELPLLTRFTLTIDLNAVNCHCSTHGLLMGLDIAAVDHWNSLSQALMRCGREFNLWVFEDTQQTRWWTPCTFNGVAFNEEDPIEMWNGETVRLVL